MKNSRPFPCCLAVLAASLLVAACAMSPPAPVVRENLVQKTATVEIEFVDTKAHTVTFRRADGAVRTVAIQTPEGRKFIQGLKKGDQVEVAYSEAMAVEVEPTG